MRILVCGDRGWTNFERIKSYLSTLPKDTIVIEGEANGADKLSRHAALSLGMKVMEFPADWDKYGKAAGPIRNKQMLVEGRPDKVVAFHSNIAKSKGTANMVNQARKAGIPVELITR